MGAASWRRVRRLSWGWAVMLALIVARAQSGFANEAPDTGCIVPINGPNTAASGIRLPGAGVLIGSERGLFFAHTVDERVAIEFASGDTGRVDYMEDFPGAGVLIHALTTPQHA